MVSEKNEDLLSRIMSEEKEYFYYLGFKGEEGHADEKSGHRRSLIFTLRHRHVDCTNYQYDT